MPKQLFVNLPVTDVARATAFYEAVGATRNPMFSNENASCMVFSDTIYAMLLSHEFFSTFTTKPIAKRDTVEVLLCLSADSREDVDAMTQKASAAGGKLDPCPKQDMGFMYGRSFEDPDGHIWEVMWMDTAGFAEADPAHAEAQPA
ncbi:MAG: VOC family protein [Caulobacteraceae bacterium]